MKNSFQNCVVSSSVGLAGREMTGLGGEEDPTGCKLAMLEDADTTDVFIVVRDTLDTEDGNGIGDCETIPTLVEDSANDFGAAEDAAAATLDREDDEPMMLVKDDDDNALVLEGASKISVCGPLAQPQAVLYPGETPLGGLTLLASA
jgi:hypothetical protein